MTMQSVCASWWNGVINLNGASKYRSSTLVRPWRNAVVMRNVLSGIVPPRLRLRVLRDVR